MTGLRCIMAYGEDDFFKGDGKGDEIYASAYIRHYDRNSFNELETGSLRKTMPYGDINKFPERVKAGHASNTGGIGGGDSIPDSASVDRRQPASQHVFPFELYNGQLANGVDAWEYDGDSGTDYNDFFLAWAQHQQSMNASIFRDPLVQSQISNNSFGPVILANLASPPDQFRYGPINNRRDQPIGMVQNGYQSWALPDATIVLTREMIEHVLSSPFAPMVPTYPPAAPIYIPKPGIMVINFSGPNNRGGFYSMIVQVERQ